MRPLAIAVVTPTVLALLVMACSSSPSPPADAGPVLDGSSGPDATVDAPSDGGAADANAGDAGGDAASARGITVTVGGSTHVLGTNARASLAGNGYSIQAAKIEGTTQYGLTVLVVKADGTMGSPMYVVPVPGAYACSATVPAVPYLWARIQYQGPEGIYQYGDPAPCVTITDFGAIGQPVKGTFSATVQRVSGTGPNSLMVTGVFDVDRMN